MKDVYGNKVKSLSKAVIVSSEEATRLLRRQLKEDKIREKVGLKPIINSDNL